MNYYSYKIEHDLGLAPNPFGGYCTLAVCKPKIRKNKDLQINDWVIGTGSKKLNNLHSLIYAMQVKEKITFNEYWEDPRFQYKKSIINGALKQMYGDNFYHQNKQTGEWIQEDSAHSLEKGLPNQGHIKKDTGGKYVLISTNFYYFGSKCFDIPKEFLEICSEGRDMKSKSIPVDVANKFITYLQSKYEPGIYGDPINWKGHK